MAKAIERLAEVAYGWETSGGQRVWDSALVLVPVDPDEEEHETEARATAAFRSARQKNPSAYPGQLEFACVSAYWPPETLILQESSYGPTSQTQEDRLPRHDALGRAIH